LREVAETLGRLPREGRARLLELLEDYGALVDEPEQLALLSGIRSPATEARQDAAAEGRVGKYHPKNKLNDLTGREWLFFTKTVLRTSYPSELGHRLRRQHYANKPPALMREIVRFFTKRRQTVLDPFAGVGGTLLGASLCNRKAVGIELEQRWLDTYLRVCREEDIQPQEDICGDCLEVMPQLVSQGRVFDAIVTDPPYSPALQKTMCDGKYGRSNRKSPFESFSSSPRDFRNSASFEEFYDHMGEAGRWFYQLLKPEKYAVVMIRDSYQDGDVSGLSASSSKVPRYGTRLVLP